MIFACRLTYNLSLLHFTSDRSTSADSMRQASALLDALDSLLGHSLSRSIVTLPPPPLASTRSTGKASVSRGGAAAASGSDLTERREGEAMATGEAGGKWRLPRAVELTMRAESRANALDPVIY